MAIEPQSNEQCLNAVMGHDRCPTICDGCQINPIVKEARQRIWSARRLISEVLASGREHNVIAESIWGTAALHWLSPNAEEIPPGDQ